VDNFVQVIFCPPRHHATYRELTHEVAWNGWHGSFTWLDDLAYDILRDQHEDFSAPDLGELRELLEAQPFPISNFKAVSRE